MVFAILSIIIVTFVPKITISQFSLESQSKQLCSDLREIRFLTMTDGNMYKILLTRNYYRVINGTKQVKKIQMRNGNQLFYKNSEIFFSPQGSPNGGTTITVNNYKLNRNYQITIVPASGRILLLEK